MSQPIHTPWQINVQSDELYNHYKSVASPSQIDRWDADVQNLCEFSPLHPTALYHSRDRSINSVLEADREHPQCHGWRDKILKKFAKTVFKEGLNTYSEVEKHKRGPLGECVLETIENAQPRADKHLRAVGIREEEMGKKINEFIA